MIAMWVLIIIFLTALFTPWIVSALASALVGLVAGAVIAVGLHQLSKLRRKPALAPDEALA